MAIFRCHSWLQTPSSTSRVSSYPRLRISSAHGEWIHDWEALVAMEKGCFREEGLKDVEEQAIREQKEEGAISEKFTMADVLRLEPLCQAQRELGIQSRV